jgi:hypothetical protein
MRALVLCLLATTALTLSGISTSTATPCTGGAQGVDDLYWVNIHCTPPDGSQPSHSASSSNATDPNAEIWVWKPICEKNNDLPGGQGLCSRLMQCPEGMQLMRHWRIRPLPHLTSGIICMPTSAANRPVITPALVLNAFRKISLPRLVAHVQPAEETLINFDTIFHADASPFTRTVRLLGQRVRLAIRPSSFRWTHGDGTSAVTSTPGAAYPTRTITYRYLHAHTTVQLHVAVTWSATYSVNGAAARPVPGTVTTIGPDTPLRIAEAIPALSGAGH